MTEPVSSERILEMHEHLGDRYLDLCAESGIRFPPPVGWLTNDAGTYTFAVIYWEEGDMGEVHAPRLMLAQAVFETVKKRFSL